MGFRGISVDNGVIRSRSLIYSLRLSVRLELQRILMLAAYSGVMDI